MRELCPWYAVSVRYQHEQTVREALQFQGFEALAPTYRVKKHWSDRVKEIDLPLFAGYVFCRFSSDEARDERIRVTDTPGVSKIVGFNGKPAPVAPQEIAAIEAVMKSGLPARPWLKLKPGDRVRIDRGPLRGIEGHLVRDNGGCQLIVAVELLQRSIAVSVDPELVTPIRASGTMPLQQSQLQTI